MPSKKFKLKGKQLKHKHVMEIWRKAMTGVVFRIVTNPHMQSQAMALKLEVVESV